MPIYEFKCSRCGAEFEMLASVGIRETECKLCSASAKLILSIPSRPIIVRPAPSGPAGFAPFTVDKDDRSIRIYDFEFGSSERQRLDNLAEKSQQITTLEV